MTANGNLKVTLEGRGQLTLRPTDEIAVGGEGRIYRANATVVKVYTDPAKMLRDGMAEKVKLLSALKHPSIIAPQGLVLEGNNPVGFYMPYGEGEHLPRLFVTDFRNRIGFGDAETVTLTERMRETVTYTHSHHALMVDGNELNWLVKFPNAGGPQPLAIDVDSWAIGKWPATVIMPSIRDWHAKAFSTATDWFSWGIVTFQLFTGIHPYKGMLNGYKPGEMERRMQQNASVFSPGIRLPHSVRSFSHIPGPLLDWYESTFQQGLRTAPPSALLTGAPARAAQVLHAVATPNGNLVFEKLFGITGNPVLRTWPCGVALLKSGELVHMGTRQSLGHLAGADAEVVATGSGWLTASRQPNGIIAFHYADGHTVTPLSCTLAISRIFRAGERLFAITAQELVEFTVEHFAKPLLTYGKRWTINPGATRWFDDVAITRMLGATFLYVPQPAGGMLQVRARELDGLTPVAAKAGNRFVAVMALDRQGNYAKLEFALDKTGQSYTLWQGKADAPDLNMALLPHGVVATVATDGELAIFVPANGNLNKVTDGGVTTAMHLANWERRVIYLHNGEVWQVRLR